MDWEELLLQAVGYRCGACPLLRVDPATGVTSCPGEEDFSNPKCPKSEILSEFAEEMEYTLKEFKERWSA